MNRIYLRRSCIEKFGPREGNLLYEAMLVLSTKDFCVATSWKPDELSISRSCNHTGTVCKLSDNYRALIFPDGSSLDITKATYDGVLNHLQPSGFIPGRKHCFVDMPVRRTAPGTF